MDKEFTNYLYALRNHVEAGDTPENSSELSELLVETANYLNSDERWQEEVYLKQQDKQAVMHELQKGLTTIDNQESPEEFTNKPGVKVYLENGFLFTERNEKLTLGDLLTGSEWNIDYNLDPETVPRSIRKRYLVEKTKAELRELTDWQIYFDQAFSKDTHELRQIAYYEAMENTKLQREGKNPKTGVLLEKMVRTFMKKLSINHSLNYEVQESDLFRDVIQKIDFIIQIKEHHRGVRFSESEELDLQNIGIQFTITTDPDKLSLKERQIARSKQELLDSDSVDDIVLATLFTKESSQLSKAYEAWNRSESKQTPDAFLSAGMKEHLFKKLLGDTQHMMDADIDTEWNKITRSGIT